MKKVRIFILIVILMVIINFLNPGIVASSLYCENDNPSMSGVFNFMKQVKIKGTKGLYEITDTGLVFSVRKKAYMKPNLSGGSGGRNQYLKIALQVIGEINKEYIHRLVAKHFVSNPKNKPQVNHKDGNKLNNHYANLEWCTYAENRSHAYRTGLMDNVGRKGELHPRVKLSNLEVMEIRKSNASHGVLAKKYSMSRSAIKCIRKRRNWKHLPEPS